MAFILKKTINKKEYYYLNENKRVDGKVKTRTIAYLGKTKKEAEKKAKEIIAGLPEKQIKAKDIKENIIKKHDIQEGTNKMEKIEKKGNKNDIKKEEQDMHNENADKTQITIEELSNFCKSKGFVFRSSDIYGGFAGFWDFGPLGVELFNNIKKEWWKFFVYEKENVVGMEASIISHPRTWKASGHIANFNDVAVINKTTKQAMKIDKNEVEKFSRENPDWEVQGEFNLMFKTKVGAMNAEDAYLRGETAQGMFMDFKLIQQTSRMQLPFGIAQIGRCFRNEIAPRDFLFRSREFNIGEFEFFINPEEKKCEILTSEHLSLKLNLLDSETQIEGKDIIRETTIRQMIEEGRLGEWHAYWLAEQIKWYNSIGLFEIKIREHTKEELSHYSSATFDIDYLYPFGSKEIGGIANRGQYDLTQHQKESKQNMEIFDEKYKKKVIPKVIEPTFGIERTFLAVLTKAYNYDKQRENVVLKLPAVLAPIKAAVFPIVKKEEFEKICRDIVTDLKKEWNVVYDESGSIGRRYSRNDEIGTPFCITVDEDSPENKDITIRDRDTKKQIRVKISELKETLKKLINQEIEFEKAGKLI
jgi:glycyl-tRNA synthetase